MTAEGVIVPQPRGELRNLVALPQVSDDHATRDRTTATDLIAEVACRDARALLKAGQPGKARFVLERAGLSIRRIEGPNPPAAWATYSRTFSTNRTDPTP